MASPLLGAPVDWAAWRAELLRELTEAIVDVSLGLTNRFDMERRFIPWDALHLARMRR